MIVSHERWVSFTDDQQLHAILAGHRAYLKHKHQISHLTTRKFVRLFRNEAAVVLARKHLLQKTDLKKLAVGGAGSGGELGRLQTRVNKMQEDISKMRKGIKDAGEKLRVAVCVCTSPMCVQM